MTRPQETQAPQGTTHHGKPQGQEVDVAVASSSPPPRPKRGRRPKAKGMPNRPLSAYNLFFKVERKNILRDMEDGVSRPDYLANAQATQKACKNNNNNKTSSNMGPAKFQAIARTIAGRWKALAGHDRKEFEDLAVKEMEAYKIKKEAWQRQVQQAQEEEAEAEAAPPAVGSTDALHESSKSTSHSTTSSTEKAPPSMTTSRDLLLGATIPGVMGPTKLLASTLPMDSMEAMLLRQQPHSLAELGRMTRFPSRVGLPPPLGSSLDAMMLPLEDPSTLWQPKASLLGPSVHSTTSTSNSGGGSLRLALELHELRRREQALLVAEHMHRQRQILHEHRILQAHLDLQEQQQQATTHHYAK